MERAAGAGLVAGIGQRQANTMATGIFEEGMPGVNLRCLQHQLVAMGSLVYFCVDIADSRDLLQ